MVEECSELGLEPRQIRFVCTDDENEAAGRVILRQTRRRRWSEWILIAVMLIAFFYLKPAEDRRAMGVSFSLAGFLYLSWRYWPRRKKDEPQGAEISENGITVTTVSSACHLPYSSFERYLESLELFVLLRPHGGVPVVIPKRAFPNEKWLSWFRTRAKALEGPVTGKIVECDQNPQTQTGTIKLRSTLALRDYFDRALFSWKLWGLLLGFALFLTGMAMYFAIFPPPKAVDAGAKLFFHFEIPWLLAMTPLLIAVGTLAPWLQCIRNRVAQSFLLSEDGLAVESRRGHAYISWARFTGYRETWWSFIVWRGFQWVLLPKRCFNSQEDLARCRDILARNVRRSCWFFG